MTVNNTTVTDLLKEAEKILTGVRDGVAMEHATLIAKAIAKVSEARKLIDVIQCDLHARVSGL